MNVHHLVHRQLPLYVSGDLAPAAVRRVEQHLQDCAACRTALQGHRSLWGRLGALGTTAVPSGRFARRVRWVPAAALLIAFGAGFLAAQIGKPWPDTTAQAPAADRSQRAYREWVGASEDRSDLFRALTALARPSDR
ncbi:MAG: zf-HC2 domain-containing protein [Planctomycetota bacterium]